METIEPGQYIPQTLEYWDSNGVEYFGTVLIELRKCPSCGLFMLSKEVSRSKNATSTRWRFRESLDKQRARAGWRYESVIRFQGEGYVCEECASEGKALFKCALCGEERAYPLMRESFGNEYNSEYLCSVCYQSVTAEKWDSKIEELLEAHRYDYE